MTSIESSQPLRVGVVSTGNIFRGAHMPAFLSNPHVQIVAVCDPHKPSACEVADQIGQVRVYEDWQEMLEHEELDIVDICSPNYLHAPVAIAALEKGLHVFCEKPDATNPEDAVRMQQAAEKSGKVLMVMRNNRFRSRSQFLKQYIDEGQMGQIYTGRCGWVRRYGIPGAGGWFTTKSKSGGGPLIDLGVHMIDLAIWLMGNPKPVAVSGATYGHFMDKAAPSGSRDTFNVEDLATGFIRFDNGATLQLEVSWASHIEKEQSFVELRGTQAGFSLHDNELQMFTVAAGKHMNMKPEGFTDGSGHKENVDHFVDVILGKADPIFTPEQGVDMIRILNAIYESAKLGQEVRLSL
ncbi:MULTISPECIES: Gfo/Idh/MocA family protein [Paenibacillus]|uniref:Gfo/Idh/MocA family oxidoreductase n=1 Tax=Paenibacillus popilliae TaxID=78057 RepID=A0ABY3AL78_PAEPP|nr:MULTISPECIES: Gfo/Idh/MocA family oxidoreductase [unclassified Paenibacillus]TQR42097.1 Gfo/Idh/MocA family oxidoreductase [Paenibacillus sp. SDF0028]